MKDLFGTISKNEQPRSGIAVDCGSVNGCNPGIFEFRLVDIASNRVIMNYVIPGETTNNLAEFFALVEGLKLTYDDIDCPVYSDSQTAISWVRKKAVKSTFNVTNVRQHKMLQDAIVFLRTVQHYTPRFWDHSRFLNNPADYNRK